MLRLPGTLAAILILLSITQATFAQHMLGKTVSVDAARKPVKEVLKMMGRQGDFHFSYNSNILREDSLVTISVQGKPVKQVLDMLFDGNLEYKEKDNYIILQRAPGYWYVSGYIQDELTGEKIPNASVYEKNQLVASLTNEQGFFRLRLKDRLQPATLSISKAWYSDTSLSVKPGNEQEITLSILPKSFALDSIVISPGSDVVENTWLGKFFLSGKQKMQSLNINKFFVEMPYQASVLPGIGTHGKMSGQVTNKISFNMLGGYAAGVDGVEIGGFFNIVKKDARYTQIAGLFNATGGKVSGVQIGGLYNHVLDSLDGVQIAGLGNMLLGSVSGVQISGLYGHIQYDMYGTQISGLSSFTRFHTDGAQVAGFTNYTGKDVDGVQVAGFINYAGRDVDGPQIAGLGNVAVREINGVQVAGLFNFTKRLNGVQVGVINIADTSAGYSIGILNIVRKGYHKLAASTNEVMNFNLAFKSGNARLYSILCAGENIGKPQLVAFGYGIGTEVPLGKRLSFHPEFTGQYLYPGNWDNANLLFRLQADLTFPIMRYLSVFAGPSLTALSSDGYRPSEDFQTYIIPGGYRTYDWGSNITSWLGWHAGVNIF